MARTIALASVVTRSTLKDFRLLKYSFEESHGTDFEWHLRTDEASAQALSGEPHVSCHIFAGEIAARPDIESAAFRSIVAQKMNAMEDAWNRAGRNIEVAFLDSDLVITGPLIRLLEATPGGVLLTPNYYPHENERYIPIHGYYNSGLILARTPDFHHWWREVFLSQPNQWTDQAVLNGAEARFRIGVLPYSSNVGFWRSRTGLQHPQIPDDCYCLHAHFFEPLVTPRQWIDRSFALHCVAYLQLSKQPLHRRIADRILGADPFGWYRAALLARESS